MKNIQKARIFLVCAIFALTAVLYGCSNKEMSAQTRSDLTSEHIRGLYADMKRSDVEDLLGKSDSALSRKRKLWNVQPCWRHQLLFCSYAGDKLQSAFIRGKDNVEEALFNNYGSHSNQINDGTTNSDGKEIGETNNPANNHETNDTAPESSHAAQDTSNMTGTSESVPQS